MTTLRTCTAVAVPALILLASNLSSRASGVESGNNSIPANASSQMPSCQQCHSGSGPSVGRTNGPTTHLTASLLVLQPGQTTSVTTAVTGGVSGTDGGFICEASAGTFTAGSTSRIITNPASITHANDRNRTWTYTYTAPNSTGLVTLTSAGLSANGSGSSGDEFSFSGYDPNATTATPMRMFVLPTGVVNHGMSCPDGFGNYSVLGANSSPTLGNAGFAVELHGATPGTFAFLIGGFNPPGFTSIDLGAMFGLVGCHGYVASSFLSLSGLTSAGSAQRGEGSLSFAIPVANSPILSGVLLDMQAAYIDPTADSMLGRTMPFSFSNGLGITFQ
ncbi:MAG: hypothetical protein KDC98_03325 [Planctomycetes bacterium]|nr:hypothetical protein [Planctomycetota bacterium]